MSIPPVFWHEGMFIRPHHFQASDRYWAEQVYLTSKFDAHHNWGLRGIEIDTEALRNYRFEVHRLAARMRDGTLIVAMRGSDQALDPLDLKSLEATLGPDQTVDIVLAVPTLRLGRSNSGAANVRYEVDAAPQATPDENSGQNPNPVPIRRLNLMLKTSTGDLEGYQTLPLARLIRSSQASAPLKLHPEYIPPLLACDGWEALDTEIMDQVYNRLGSLVKQLARLVKDQNIRFDTNNPEQRKIFEQLRALNEAYAAFGVLAPTQGIHPLLAYLELCRLVGKLAVFSKDATLNEELPPYDHDNLGHCFYTLKRYIDELLSLDFNQGYEVRPFIGEGLRMKVAMEPTWMAPACQMLVGVQSNLKPDECARLLTGRLNMKIGSLERVEEIYQRGLRGLDFVHDHKPPSVLPTPQDMTYFRINRDVSKEEWIALNASYVLGIRLNETKLLGTIDQKTEVTIQADAKNATLKFTLYVVLPGVTS